tara:strand:- start:1573 stop:2559 length:987 start_codon:yes stop_codon:yes gene_type:complete
MWLSLCFILFLAGFIASRPYIKKIVNEVKFTYVAEEYKKIDQENKKVVKKNKKKSKEEKEIFKTESDNAISLNVQTTINLFEDLKYDLKKIRNGQQVKPVYFTKLPKDINTLGNTKQKKNLFIQIVLPLILAENKKITDDRKKLFNIVSKNFNTIGERTWIKRRFKEYKVEDSDLAELKTRMDIIPASIAIAQAAKESGWGTSRFALEGNALFGQWTWSKSAGIEPIDQDEDKNHKILAFQILRASVKAYKNNLNTHNGYKEFREARAKLRQEEKKVTGLDLSKFLNRYAATGKEYTKIIEKIILQNELTDFDNAKLLSTKSKKGVSL